MPALIIIASYILGSIPAAYIIGKLAKGIDIRTVGSGNVGALNVLHQVGPAAALVVLVFDTLKGALAIYIAMALADLPWGYLYAAIGVVAGHNWPVFLKFQGGKGAATVLGVSLAVQPLLTIAALAPAILSAVLARNVVLGAALGFTVLNVLTVVTGQGLFQILLCLLLTFVVTATYLGRSWRHTVSAVQRRRWRDLFSFE